MDINPLQRNYGLSKPLVTGILILLVLLIGGNIFTVLNTDFGASFYSYWLSSRVLFAQGENPYNAQFFEQVMANYPSEAYPSGFTLPLYSVLFVVLFSFINNFNVALILWMTLLEAALIYAGIRLLSALQISRKTFTPLTIGIVMFCSYYAVVAILDGDLGIFSVMLLMMALDAVREHEDEFAGILLAFATMKYSLTLLPILWVLIWCLANHRGTIAAWFAMVFALLLLVSTLFMTNWVLEFARSVIYYYKYMDPVYISRLIKNWQPELGGRIGWALSGFFAVVLLIEWVVNAHGNQRAFEWVTALTIAIGFLVGFPNIGKNLYFLWMPMAYALDKINQRWTNNGHWLSLAAVLAFLILPWVNQIGLFPTELMPIDWLNLFFPVLCVLLLYWNRWWTIQAVVDPY